MDTNALRQKILDLAIRGKLVPQDPNDEPASVLLERIRKEKQQMVKEGKLKPKDIKNDTVIFKGEDSLHYEKFQDGTVKCIEDEMPFEVPEGWAWTRIASVSSIVTDGEHKTPRRCENYSGYYLLSARNIQNSFLLLDNVDYVDREEYSRISKRCNPKRNDILISCSGSVGRVAVIEDDNHYVMVRSAAMIRFIDLNPYFGMYALQSHFLQTQIQKLSKQTAQANLFQGAILNLLLPIPPFNEQREIAKKLSELFKYIHEIENNKIIIEDLLKRTKAKILDIAIQGKLVPQNPDDEPASVLLECIRSEKEELIKQGKIKRGKKESIIFKGEDNSYYDDIPVGWAVCYLKELFNVCSAKRVRQSDWCSEGVPFYRAREIVKLSDNGFVDNELYISEKHYNQIKEEYGIPQSGDLMVSAVGTIGKVYIVKDTDRFYYKDASVLCFENRKGLIDSQYAKYMLMSNFVQNQMKENSKGTTVDTITISSAINYVCLIPPVNEQKRIVSTIEQLLNQLNLIELELA